MSNTTAKFPALYLTQDVTASINWLSLDELPAEDVEDAINHPEKQFSQAAEDFMLAVDMPTQEFSEIVMNKNDLIYKDSDLFTGYEYNAE